MGATAERDDGPGRMLAPARALRPAGARRRPDPARRLDTRGQRRGRLSLLRRRAASEPTEPSWRSTATSPGSALLAGSAAAGLHGPTRSTRASSAGSKWGQQDQEFSLRGGRLGLWEVGFDWDQIPHIYSTNARLLATEMSPGVFTLPKPRPPLDAYKTARSIDESACAGTRRASSSKLTPTPERGPQAPSTRGSSKHGERPFGMAFGSPGGNCFRDPRAHRADDPRLPARRHLGQRAGGSSRSATCCRSS